MAAALMPSRAPTRTRKNVSAANSIRAFAAQRRVFSYAEAAAVLGQDVVRSLGAAVTRGDVASPAAGVFTLPEIPGNDDRVLAKISETGARKTSPAVLKRRAAKAEEKRAKEMARAASAERMVDRVRRFAGRHAVFSRSDVRTEFGPSGPGSLDQLIVERIIRQVQPGLYCRPDVDPVGEEMRAYITAQGNAFADARRRIEEALAKVPESDRPVDRSKVTYNVFTPHDKDGTKKYRTRVYVNVPGYPSIYAVSVGRKGSVGIDWHGQDKSLGSLAAEMIARRVFRVMPPSMSEFIAMVTEGSAPVDQRTRTGAYEPEEVRNAAGVRDMASDDGVQRTDRPDEGDGFRLAYHPSETERLDPAHMTTPLPETVTLEMDNRDPDRLFSILSGVPNLHVVRTTLEIGDFRARHGTQEMIFERKTSADFVASLDRKDGRLVRQVRALSERGSPCCIIVEGGVYGARAASIRQLARIKSRLIFGKRIPLAETVDQRETAYFIVSAIHDHFFGADAAFEMEPVRDPSASTAEVSISILRAIPGVSKARAIAMLERFGSIAGVARATVEKLRNVEGIGPKTAETIVEVLRAGGGRRRK